MKKLFIFAFMLAPCAIAVTPVLPAKETPLVDIKPIKKIKPTSIDTFSEEVLIKALDTSDLKFPHIALAQAKLETGHFKSKIFKENFNLFGMKQARIRENTAKGTRHNHAYYEDWKSSVTDYILWVKNFAKDANTEEEFYEKLGPYSESSYYQPTLKKIIERENLKSKFE